MINVQEPQKQVSELGSLHVNSIFDTIQGEGPFQGYPATFIRLAGCNLQCTWCDTAYTEYTPLDIDSIGEQVNKTLVVITGGEPLRQNIIGLINLLKAANHVVQVETNGTLWNEGLEKTGCIVMVSPKTKKMHPKIVEQLKKHELFKLKLVVGKDAFPSQPGGKGGLVDLETLPVPPQYVLPLDTGIAKENQRNINECIHIVNEHRYMLFQLQIHKIIGVE